MNNMVRKSVEMATTGINNKIKLYGAECINLTNQQTFKILPLNYADKIGTIRADIIVQTEDHITTNAFNINEEVKTFKIITIEPSIRAGVTVFLKITLEEI
jgi:hypothetical protein